MAGKFLIGIDAGGGGGRCLIADIEKQTLFTVNRSWSHLPVSDGGGWSFDLDLRTIWQALGEAVQEALRQAGALPGEVAGIAVTSMRHSLIVLDKHTQVLFAAPNRDARAADQSMELAAVRGSEFYQRTGHFPNPILTACRLRWLIERTPQLFEKANVILTLSEWLAYRLCGQFAADFSHAGETMLCDLKSRHWAWDLIQSLGLPKTIFPTVSAAGTLLGKLSADAAAHLGLTAGIPVAVGGADTQCGLLGCGVVKPGQLGIIAGTTTPLQMIIDQLILDARSRLWTGLNVIPGQYIIESNAGSTGEALEWLAHLLYPAALNPITMLDAEAAQSIPGAAGMLSTFATQIFDGSNMILPFGYLAISHLIGSGQVPPKQHLVRAVLEGMAFSVRANAEQMGSAAGVSLPEFFLSGGISHSSVWSRILSDVLAQPITVSSCPDATALGAAICAGVGAGIFKNLADGSTALVGKPNRINPLDENVEVYQEIFVTWQEFRTAHTGADELVRGGLLKGISSTQVATGTLRELAFRPSILVTAQIDEIALGRLRHMGEVTYQNYRDTFTVLTGDDLVHAMQGKQVLITEVDVVDVDALVKLPDLKLVASCRGNAVNIDAAACTALGVPLINTPGRNAGAVADLAVAFMLMLTRKLVPAVQFLHDPEGEAGDLARMGSAYSQFQGSELWRKTIGLIGMGAIGRGVIQRLLPFGARVLVYDPYLTPEQVTLAGAEKVPLDELLKTSDIVSLHAPANPQTAGMLGANEFGMMKPGAFLINTARASLTDEAALVEALRSGHLGGAALDVFASEPPGPQDPLLTAPNVIATPHLGGNTFDVAAHQGEIIADELERILRGERPRFLVNPETFDSFSWMHPRPMPPAETLANLRRNGGPAVSDLDARSREDNREELKIESVPIKEQQPKARESFFSSLRSKFAGKQSPEEAPATSEKTPEISEKGSQIAMFEQIIRAFLAECEKDPALINFAANRVFSMYYGLTDASLEFYMVFEKGTVKAGMGTLPVKADLTLKMKADIFDGMMTGRINATNAAMTGKMKFSGDTSKAMQMQRIQKDFMRLYILVRQQIGDPGDLTRLSPSPAPSGSTSAAPMMPITATAGSLPAVPVPPSTQAAVQVIKMGDERDELVAAVQELYEKNLITATGGNVSIRSSHDVNELWITPSALFKGSLYPGMLVRINLEGDAMDENSSSPSSERWVHTEILKARPDLNAVIHAHAPWATLLALTDTSFLPITTEAAFIGEIPRLPFIMPGTRELAMAVSKAVGEQGSVVLLQNHGLVVAGSSLRRAVSNTEVVERCSELILRSLALGKQPPTLPEDIVKTLRDMGQMMA